jgi:uncharacterized membrane protein YbhN (UPF0104 family)
MWYSSFSFSGKESIMLTSLLIGHTCAHVDICCVVTHHLSTQNVHCCAVILSLKVTQPVWLLLCAVLVIDFVTLIDRG